MNLFRSEVVLILYLEKKGGYMRKKICHIFCILILLCFLNVLSIGNINSSYVSSEDVSVSRLVRSSQWGISATNPVLFSGRYGLRPEAVRLMQIDGNGIKSEMANVILNNLLVQMALSMNVLPAIIANLRAGEGIELGGKEYKATKDDMDLNTVELGDRQMQMLSEETGIVFVLLGAEGPGRDDAPGGLPGTIFYWEGKITPAEVEKLGYEIPKTPQDVVKILEAKGVKINDITGIVGVWRDSLEGTNFAARNQAGANSLVGLVMYLKDSNASLPFTPDRYILGYSWSTFEGGGEGTLGTIKPWDPPEVMLKKYARAQGKSLEEVCREVHFLILDRGRHESIIHGLDEDDITAIIDGIADILGVDENIIATLRKSFIENITRGLKGLQDAGYDITYTTGDDFNDGDFTARVAAALGEEIDGRKIIVVGGGGSNEVLLAFLAANLSQTGGGAGVHMTTDKKDLMMNDVLLWGIIVELLGKTIAGRNYTAEEIAEFQALGIDDPSQPFTERDVGALLGDNVGSIVSFASVTGARNHIVGTDWADLMVPVRIVFDSKGGAEIYVRVFFTYGDSQYVAEIPFHTDDLDRTKELLLKGVNSGN